MNKARMISVALIAATLLYIPFVYFFHGIAGGMGEMQGVLELVLAVVAVISLGSMFKWRRIFRLLKVINEESCHRRPG